MLPHICDTKITSGIPQLCKLQLRAAEAKFIADDLTRLIDTANAPIFGVNLKGVVCDMRPADEAVGGSFKSSLAEVF